ncbi:MAG: phytanoyl-CoA dioxygenase family protein [Anaerolineales bacterium]|jgi:ectoine hydroxylase-related dioxygenase (phytanoyl-CoA dioxygenase family)
MNTFVISADEKARQQFEPERLDQAIRSVQEDGYVILENCVDREHAEILRDKILADTDTILARDDVPFNFNVGNIQQDPPPYHPYLFEDVLLNPFVIAITKSVLGSGLKNSFYSGNTALPKQGGRQPVHADSGQLWPNLEKATPPYALVVNVLPVDVSPQNGSTEIWPGTHLDTTISYQSGDIKVPEDVLEARRKVSPPLQATVPAGTVVIRDIRLWHAGMPNHSESPRPMIAMIHYVAWWNEAEPIVFPKGTEDFFKHPDLATHAVFVEEPIDYLHRHTAFDLKK